MVEMHQFKLLLQGVDTTAMGLTAIQRWGVKLLLAAVLSEESYVKMHPWLV